ncbi:MAG TPA: hypothetical protein VE993_10130 [Stellaceae bacterium]|nr:hypothetical protein [Stellaceae bacterium]
MSPETETANAATASTDAASQHHDRRIERLIARLPNWLQTATRWLRRPSSRWIRLPAGVILIGGSFLSILPFFGLWMLPLGLMLLAEDVPPLRRARERILDFLERRRPHWFTGSGAESRT